MAVTSAGILLFRIAGKEPEVLLVHPGGPFFTRKDAGYWSVPKGEYTADEAPLAAAIREFFEETGMQLAEDKTFYPLGSVKQKGGKEVHAWAVEGDLDAGAIVSNTFELEWPKGSGRYQSFPEIDKAAWFGMEAAIHYINERQRALIAVFKQLSEEGLIG